MKQADGQRAHQQGQQHRFAQAGCAVTDSGNKHAGKCCGQQSKIVSDKDEADNACNDAADPAQIRFRAVVQTEMGRFFLIGANQGGERLFFCMGSRGNKN